MTIYSLKFTIEYVDHGQLLYQVEKSFSECEVSTEASATKTDFCYGLDLTL